MKLNAPGGWRMVWLLLVPALSLGAAQTQVLIGHVPPVVANLTAVGWVPATNHLRLAVGLPLRHRPALTTFIQQLYDPASPLFRHYLTPDEFTRRFGPTEEDYQAVISFARDHDLRITATHGSRTLLDVEGPVSAIEKAFRITLRRYQHPVEKRVFFAPDAEPSVDVSVPVLTVGGLNDYFRPHPISLKAESDKSAGLNKLLSGSAPGGNYWGADFRAAYVPGVALTGTGQSVGLLEFDGYTPSDITSYESQAGIPSVLLSNVYVDGATGAAGPDNDEVSLDIEMAVSMAPGLSQVLVYESVNDATLASTDDVLERIASDDLANQISASWTYPIDATSDQYFLQMAAQGQTFFNASGDSDSYYNAGGIPPPCDDTNIVSVGGTTLTTAGPGSNWVSETVWNWGYDANDGYDVGSSGGVSSTYAIPQWQQGVNMQTNQGSTTMRNLPDVALTANDVWVDYNSGASGSFGGTSCAAPLWAAFTALVNEQAADNGRPPVGFLNPAVYAIGMSSAYASDFHDITTGANTNSGSPNLYFACPGYDLCTGWGTPNGANLIYALSVPEPLQIIPTQGFISSGPAGGPFSVTNQTFALTNISATNLTWSVGNTAPWVTASPASGPLPTNGPAASVTLSLVNAAYSLPPGSYTNLAWFTNTQDGVAQSRQCLLLVIEPLVITPALGFSSTGAVDGPFTVTNQSLILSNLGGAPVNWTAGMTSPWLTVSNASGTLAARSSGTGPTIGLGAAAYSLGAGNYFGTVSITNVGDGSVQSREFALAIVEIFQVAPAQGFSASGPPGGPFTVTSLNFEVADVGASSVNWGSSHASTWLNVAPASGLLAPNGGATTVTASLAAAAYSLPIGNYSDVVSFTNINDGTVLARPFTLVIQPLVLNGGFETGTFADWTGSGAFDLSYCLIVHNNTNYVHSGTYGAALGTESLGYISQTITTAPGQLYLVSLWLNCNGATPNEFLVDWGNSTLFNESNIGRTGWTNLLYMVQAPGSSSVLELGFMDGPSFLGLDDVSVEPVSAPAFEGASRNGSSFNLTWSTVPGATYQVQYTTNILSTNWLNLGNPIAATTSTASIADTMGTNHQRFYRIALVP